ncbi:MULTISPECIES: hypothetical protein [Burkholderiaceae]|uniref:hypothetical protein n=1 Tax=Burkholderiaceae TaxID=119060 RepID=UPI0012EAF7D4|nr:MULTISPECIES: hypothetical protein [Burkholderiaceae]MBU7436135.1 hypothetical protein [Paraburkholderia fungorum]HDR9495448.1 hypothetical protein [Burkholderia stabilis]HDR9526363.1 hypothetical protein [Burkholderia stabilis]HDR9533676.1 hypothetical protein [Burkholderia stabilis]HDR9542344.1 hypothetical protein [Burkholderia stabilis]
MSKRTALQLKEPNHDDPKVARLTNVIARKNRVHGVNASGERVAYEWDGVTGEWRRDWDFGSIGPARHTFGDELPLGPDFRFDRFKEA